MSSYASGASDSPLEGITIGDLLDRTIAAFADNEALVVPHQQVRWTYREFGRRVDELARAFLGIGVGKGERVGIWSTNRSEWVLTQFATSKIGAILVNLNPSYRSAELEYALNQSGCRFLVMTDAFKTSDYNAVFESIAPEVVTQAPGKLKLAKVPSLEWVITLGSARPGRMTFAQLLEQAPAVSATALENVQASLQFDDPINIQYTSGTTGFPKGATLSHHNIANNGYFVAKLMRFSHRDRLVIPVPLYHCFGMVMGNLGCVSHGATMIYPAEAFDAQATLAAAAQEKATALYGVPTMFIAELALPNFSAFDLTSLRTGIMAGAPCPVEVMKRVQSEMHMSEVAIAYGMTETSPVSMQTRIGTPLEKQVSTVGQVHPHVEIKIVDPESGAVLPRGELGEFCTRGYSVMLGYWSNPQATAEAIDTAGWMHTGDLAVMDADGYVNIAGRIKDMIIRGGENIYPREIEEFLYRHPQISEVQVIGVPDPKYGEELMAWIQPTAGASLTEADVKAFCQGQIAHYKVPRYVRFVAEFPMTVTGKIQKFKMREDSIAALGLKPADKTA
ncbi:MAG: AMP-binding protein [Gammaproteobacteria bacterium]|nr:AMP-binding protein [Gammaproteobacteria bacterium]